MKRVISFFLALMMIISIATVSIAQKVVLMRRM